MEKRSFIFNTEAPKHCTPMEVDAIRDTLRDAGISDQQIANILGVSRTNMNLMFNHLSPCRTIYRWAIAAVLAWDKSELDAVRKLPDRWNGEDGEYLGADDCAEELLAALRGENDE